MHAHPVRVDTKSLIKSFKAQCKLGHLHEALHLLYQLEEQGYKRSSYTYVSLLQGCIEANVLHEGRLLHVHLINCALITNIFLSTTLANMYAWCGCIEDAQVVFYGMSERNLVAWSMMIAAYCMHGKFDEGVKIFWKMQDEGWTPDEVNYVSALKACAGLGSLEEGRKIHECLKGSEFKPNVLVANSLMNMYIKCRSLEDAQQVFDAMEEHDSGSFSVMIAGLTKADNAEGAIRLFSSMQSRDVKPDEVTFLSILNACGVLGDLRQAKQAHEFVKKSGVQVTRSTWNTLIDMYAKCGSLSDACELFDEMYERDVVTWNAMIAGLSNHGCSKDALKLHGQMTIEGILRDEVSFVSIFNACTALEDLECGKKFHSQIVDNSAFVNGFVENALIDMYAKCGNLSNARNLFDRMKKRNVVSWNSMLVGYGKHELDQEVLLLFERMASEDVKPDEVTYVRVLNACANTTALDQGLQLHHQILVGRQEFDVFVGNALVDMYAKCGRIRDAWKVLHRMSKPDIVSWNALLAGFSQHGLGSEALQLMQSMIQDQIELNHVSFVGILSACSHAGLLYEGRFYFTIMDHVYGVPQAIEHYGCIIDLLGRAGHLQEAAGLLKQTSFEASVVLWRALLSACKIHGHVGLAISAAERILDLDPEDGGVLILLSNIHASLNSLQDQAAIITLMNDGEVEEDESETFVAFG